MHFNWDMSLGTVITSIGMLIGFWTAHNRGIERIKELETKINILFEWWQDHIRK